MGCSPEGGIEGQVRLAAIRQAGFDIAAMAALGGVG